MFQSCIWPWLARHYHLNRHSITNGVPLKHRCAILYRDFCFELDNGFITSDVRNLHFSRNRIPGSHRCLEAPIHLEKNRSRAREFLCYHRVQNCTGDPALNNDPFKSRGGCCLLIIVHRVAVAADLREELDVSSSYFSRHPDGLTGFRHSIRTGFVGLRHIFLSPTEFQQISLELGSMAIKSSQLDGCHSVKSSSG